MNPENRSYCPEGVDTEQLKDKLSLKSNADELRESIQSLIALCPGDKPGDAETGGEEYIFRPASVVDKRFRKYLSVVSDELNSKELRPERVAATLQLLVEDATYYLFDILTPDEKLVIFPVIAKLYERLMGILNISNPQDVSDAEKPLSELTKNGQVADIDWHRIMLMASEISNQLSFLQ